MCAAVAAAGAGTVTAAVLEPTDWNTRQWWRLGVSDGGGDRFADVA